MGQHFPIVCLHLEPVFRFAVPMILNFLVVETQDFMGGNVNKLGQRVPIVCLHLELVFRFAVPMILNFLVEETQDFMGKCLLPVCSLILRRVNIISEFIYHEK